MADVSAGSVHNNSLARDVLARDAALLTDTVREAGALALSLFRTELKNWTKGASSPVSEADIAVNDLIEKRLRSRHAGLRLAVGRKRRRRSAAGQASGLDRRSDRRHPRLSRRPRRLVRQRGAGRTRLAGAGGGVRAGQRRILLRRCAARAPHATSVPVHATSGTELDFSRIAGPKPLVERLSRSSGEITLYPRIGSLALRLCRVAEGRLDAAFAGGQSRDWDLAAANLIVQEANGNMTALSGDSHPLQPPGGDARGAGGSGARSSCEHCRAFPEPSVALSALEARREFCLAGHRVRKTNHAR